MHIHIWLSCTHTTTDNSKETNDNKKTKTNICMHIYMHIYICMSISICIYMYLHMATCHLRLQCQKNKAAFQKASHIMAIHKALVRASIFQVLQRSHPGDYLRWRTLACHESAWLEYQPVWVKWRLRRASNLVT